ncbi:hypothetical protein OOZ54_08560 [Rhodopseudomonas palustris]|uniref:hypothetical protein n=1 Tax=Rhodopseudomonas palustris TaxID=1076 RepID=UPI001237605E|nr:hypothetical protein [Rhodopseudomonas palustris]WBU31533.1 hypothetical protein OOZ54_08560 [Rhodopseudomonas palustris]
MNAIIKIVRDAEALNTATAHLSQPGEARPIVAARSRDAASDPTAWYRRSAGESRCRSCVVIPARGAIPE